MNLKSILKTAMMMAIPTLFMLEACKEDPKPSLPPSDETELITTVKLEFTDSASSAVHYAVFSDPDGEGGNGPVRFDTIRLNKGSIYATRILLLDESKTPADTISNEVSKESDEHLFVFNPKNADINIQILDKDNNMLPVGLLSRWRTGKASQGVVNVMLKHQPGVKDGSPAPGETDVQVEFNCIIE
jgi:hypothetical protein